MATRMIQDSMVNSFSLASISSRCRRLKFSQSVLKQASPQFQFPQVINEFMKISLRSCASYLPVRAWSDPQVNRDDPSSVVISIPHLEWTAKSNCQLITCCKLQSLVEMDLNRKNMVDELLRGRNRKYWKGRELRRSKLKSWSELKSWKHRCYRSGLMPFPTQDSWDGQFVALNDGITNRVTNQLRKWACKQIIAILSNATRYLGPLVLFNLSFPSWSQGFLPPSFPSFAWSDDALNT
jgi:hypothetical protein